MTDTIKNISWWGRIKESFKGILVGLVFIALSIFLLFWNENQSIKTKRSLIEASKLVKSIPTQPVNSQNDEKLIYTTGLATTEDKLYDNLLDITLNAISLHRTVEMYQWVETQNTDTKSNIGGSQTQTTHHNYHKEWRSELINSSQFNDPLNHQNPKAMYERSQRLYAAKVTLGDFILPKELVMQINNEQAVSLGESEIIKVKKEFRMPANIVGNHIYLGTNPNTPEVGDMKVGLSAVYPQNVSIIAVQVGNTFEPYVAKAGMDVMLIEPGNVTANQMIQNALEQNKLLTWIIRILSLFFMIIGVSLIFKPLVVIADVIPFLGTLFSYGTGFISVLIGVGTWSILFAIAWFAVRPIMSISILTSVVGIIYFYFQKKKKELKEQ